MVSRVGQEQAKMLAHCPVAAMSFQSPRVLDQLRASLPETSIFPFESSCLSAIRHPLSPSHDLEPAYTG